MENSVRSRPARNGRRPLDRFEEDMLAAKNSGKIVHFDLAVSTGHTDTEGTLSGKICQVDKYAIQIELAGKNRRIWIAKAMIVTTEVE